MSFYYFNKGIYNNSYIYSCTIYNNSAAVLEENNFYPFGLKHEGYNAQPGNASYTYQYNSKELQREPGWNDYGARMYMSDIGRWGVVDPLAETTTRVSPYNYALNNPIRFIDPDGRKALPPDQDRQLNIPVNGFAFYFASGGSGRTKAIKRFFGPGDGLGEFFNMDDADEGGGGGGSNAGMTFTSPYMIAFIQQGILQPGFINGLFSVIEQLKKVGFKNPAKDKIAFIDYKKIIKTDAISELLGVYYNASKTKKGYEYGFIEVNSSLFKGRADGGKMLISPKNISNVLDYFFTIGHEINHSIMGYFRSIFYETINSTPNSVTARSAFDYFGEYNSYSWEQKLGNADVSDAWKVTYSKHGPEAKIQDLYIGYPQPSIDVVKNNLIKLEKAWSIFYNNNLKK